MPSFDSLGLGCGLSIGQIEQELTKLFSEMRKSGDQLLLFSSLSHSHMKALAACHPCLSQALRFYLHPGLSPRLLTYISICELVAWLSRCPRNLTVLPANFNEVAD